MSIGEAIEHLKQTATELAIDGPVTQEELDGFMSAIECLEKMTTA